MKVFGFPTFNLTKVLMTAEEVGQDYVLVPIDPLKGGLKDEANLQRHPFGKMPSLEDGGEFLFETAAMCRYIASKNHSSLYAGTELEKARIDQWADVMNCHIGRWLQVYYWEEIVKPNYFNQETSQQALDEAADMLLNLLPVFDAQLGRHPFVAGSEITIADTLAFGQFTITDLTSASIGNYPDICRWMELMRSRTSYQNLVTQKLIQGAF